jgi:quinol monooxygenase YgiN
MFALVARFDMKDLTAAGQFDALVERTSAGIIAKEPGTLVYATHLVDGEPLGRIFYELYVDRAAFDAHEAQPHTRTFLEERDRYVATTRVEFMGAGPIVAKGLPRPAGDE